MRRAQRSRSFRKIRQNTPGGKKKVKLVKKRASRPVCGACKRPLAGTAGGRKNAAKKVSGSRKTPNRMYGGNLCHRCTREMIKERVFKEGA